MTLVERFKNLTPEQQTGFSTVKDGEGLEAFLRQTGLEFSLEEKEQILEYIVSGKMPLSDEELESVAGGGCGDHQSIMVLDPITKKSRDILEPIWKMKIR